MSKFNKSPSRYVDGHGMKGIVGKERAESYEPSSYSGDKGGSAGANGVGPSHAYGGAALGFEGGVRAGGVSETETTMGQQPYPKKGGFDERRGHGMATEGSVHGLPGVEGIKPPKQPPGDHGLEGQSMTEQEPGGDTTGSDGYSCKHGCGNMKSKHGLARHYFSKHGGFGGLGHALHESHGSSYKPGQEFKGETEGKPQLEQIKREWEGAKPSNKPCSSYSGGDGGGSCGKV